MADTDEQAGAGLLIAGRLADPAAGFALKAVGRDWAERDCIDAAQDARILCRVFGREADRRLGRV